MITVGYGDIYAFNTSEMFYAINMMMICCGMFAYLIGNISNLITQANMRYAEHSEAIVSANNWM